MLVHTTYASNCTTAAYKPLTNHVEDDEIGKGSFVRSTSASFPVEECARMHAVKSVWPMAFHSLLVSTKHHNGEGGSHFTLV